MQRLLITTLLLIQAALPTFAQTRTISGTVVDSLNKTPVADVIIHLLDANGKALSYTFSKNDGTFSLPCPVEGKNLLFKSIGYRQQILSVSGKPLPSEIFLVNEPIQLRDVIIKAPDILMKNDTLVYNVQKYADAQDRSIADVLKKMPGVEVSESGQIKYNGKPINKFYIEGNDLLEGRYGLATNNISHQDVQNVEIMENHQPIRALDGIEYSEQAGLNLRLKEDAKLRWSGVVNGGTGFSPALYDVSLFAMRIAGKLQSMETARINNTGWNPVSQTLRHTSDNLFGTTALPNVLRDYISVGTYTTPIEERRTRFNQSYLFNTTHSFKLKNNYDMKANIMYERDNLDFTRSSYTDYFDNSISPLTETEDLQTRTSALSGQFVWQSNQPNAYLKNNFHSDFKWNDAASTITGVYGAGQNAEKPQVNIANELQITNRIKNRILTVSSNNSFTHKSQSLLVETGGKTVHQEVKPTLFQSQTEAGYGWIFGQWKVRGRAGLEYRYNALESAQTGTEITAFPLTNHSQLSRTNLYARPEIIYETKHLRLNPYFLIHYYAYLFHDKEAGERRAKHYGIISPALSVRYKFFARMELFADAKYSITPPSPDNFYRGLIMSDYRRQSVGYPTDDSDARYSAGMSLSYRNPLSSVFAHIGSRYEKTNAALTPDQLFVNEQIVTAYRPLPNAGEIFTVVGGLSKGLFSGKIHVGMDMGYTQIATANLRNTVLVPYELKTLSLTPSIKGTLSRWMAVEYRLSAARNAMNLKNGDAGSSYKNLKQNLSISLFPVKKIQATIGAEHYHTNFNDHTADNLVLIDASARWNLSGKVDISLSATNLLNEKYYRYSRHETLSETTYSCRIRPRNVLAAVRARF